MSLIVVIIFGISSVFQAIYTAKKIDQKMTAGMIFSVGILTIGWGTSMVHSLKPAHEIIKLFICYQLLLSAAIIDHKKHKIPNNISGGLLAIGVLSRIGEPLFLNEKSACFLVFAETGMVFMLFFLCYCFLKEKIGAGDLKLLAGISMLCGIRNLFVLLMISFDISLLMLGSDFFYKERRGRQIPLAPVLYVSFFILFLK